MVDVVHDRASAAAAQFGCPAFMGHAELSGKIDAAIVAVPTSAHAEVGCDLMEAGIDVLVEKPITPDRASAESSSIPPRGTGGSSWSGTWNDSTRA